MGRAAHPKRPKNGESRARFRGFGIDRADQGIRWPRPKRRASPLDLSKGERKPLGLEGWAEKGRGAYEIDKILSTLNKGDHDIHFIRKVVGNNNYFVIEEKRFMYWLQQESIEKVSALFLQLSLNTEYRT